MMADSDTTTAVGLVFGGTATVVEPVPGSTATAVEPKDDNVNHPHHYTQDGGDVFVVLPEWDSRVFVHEAYHAAQAVLRIIGTQDEELGAFLVEWLFGEICWDVRPGERKRRQ